MSERLTAILGWLTLILVLGALWALFGEDPRRNPGARGGPLLEAGASAFDGAKDITLSRGEDRLHFQKSGADWALASRSGFPADATQIRDLLRGLIRSQRREPKTSNQDRFDQLDLGDMKALHLIVKGANDATLADILIGKRSQGATGRSLTYVFREGDSRAWLVSDLPALSIGVSDWLQDGLFSLSQTRIKAAQFDGYRLEAMDQGGAPQVSPVPAGREPEADWKQRSAFRVLSTLAYVDVQQVANPLFEPTGSVTLTSFDGLSLTLTLYQPEKGSENTSEKAGDIWFSLDAVYSLDAAETGAEGVIQDAPEDGPAEAARLAALADGWLFKAAPELQETLLAGLDAYLIPKAEEGGTQQSGPEAPSGTR